MGKHWRLLLLACFWSSSALHGFQQDNTSTNPDAARREDSYAVYSALLADPQVSGESADKNAYMVQGKTIPFRLSTDYLVCLERTPANEPDWREVLAEFSQYKYSPETLEQRIKTTRPVVLLDEKGIAEVRASQSKQLFGLSPVFFNQKRTLALTQIAMYCGGRCGEGGWRAFEKIDGAWLPYRRPPGSPNCWSGWVN